MVMEIARQASEAEEGFHGVHPSKLEVSGPDGETFGGTTPHQTPEPEDAYIGGIADYMRWWQRSTTMCYRRRSPIWHEPAAGHLV